MRKRKASDNPFLQFRRTDAGNAKMFAAVQNDAKYNRALRYDHARKRWIHWTGQRWEVCSEKQEQQLFLDTLDLRLKSALTMPSDDAEGKGTERTDEIHFVFLSEQRAKIEAALALAQSEIPVRDNGEDWDADSYLFGVANGILDLRTGQLRFAKPEDRVTKYSKVVFDPAAKCPRFLQFLNEVFPNQPALILFIQKAAGYTLTGSVDEECLFLNWGTGRNGKSTLFEILYFIMGDYATDVPFSALESKGSQRFGMTPNLPGSRFVKSLETDSKRKDLDMGKLKKLTGGDTDTNRNLFQNAKNFTPTHKLWLACNEKPNTNDTSPATWERIKLIPYRQNFTGDKCEKGLKRTLRSEASGILNWMLEGCLAWQKEGLVEPSEVRQATEEYRAESDVVGRFLNECCERGADYLVPVGALNAEYEAWKRANDVSQKISLPAALNNFGFRQFTHGEPRTRHWKGLRLQQVTEGRTSEQGEQRFYNPPPVKGYLEKDMKNTVRTVRTVRPSPQTGDGMAQFFDGAAVLDSAETRTHE